MLSLPLLLAPAQGCHSAMVDATIRNNTPADIRLIEVQYPSATFGVQILASGAEFHQRFKILGTGNLVLTYTDQSQHEHTEKGPELREGLQGKLGIMIGPQAVQWAPLPIPDPR